MWDEVPILKEFILKAYGRMEIQMQNSDSQELYIKVLGLVLESLQSGFWETK